MAEWIFNKPTHFTPDGKMAWCNLWVEKIRDFRKAKQMIELVIDGKKCIPVDPKILLKYGKKVEAVYLYPDRPMKMRGMYFELETEEDKLQELSKQCF